MKITIPGLVLAVSTGVAVAGAGCGSNNSESGFDSGSGSSSGGGSSDSGSGTGDGTTIITDSSYGSLPDVGQGPPPPEAGVGCTNLQCNIATCEGGTPTSISGKVFDPAGRNPLYNVVVFVPNTTNGALPLIPSGVNSASCNCAEVFQGEEPIVDTVTAADGTFTLKNVPSGTNIPVVVQIGKWRKEIIMPSVLPCQDNPVVSGDAGPAGRINLPRSGSDGLYASLPNIAVSTGYADTLECLLTRVGVDESEFSGDPNTPSAHVHVFQGGVGSVLGPGNSTANPSSPSSASSLWDKDSDIERYDIVMLSCEGTATTGANSQTVADYVNLGGRVFAEHYHYQFFYNSALFPNLATWQPGEGNSYTPPIDAVIQTTLPNGNAFQEGQALEQWLTNVGALTNNELPITVPRGDALVGATNVSTPWAVTTGVTPVTTQYFSWDMPFNAAKDDAGVPQYCGRVVFSDMHVSGCDGNGSAGCEDYTTAPYVVPTGCDATAALKPTEDAIEFILFDLSSCLVPIGYPPKPPPTYGPEGGIQ
jgi:hypothetical protein